MPQRPPSEPCSPKRHTVKSISESRRLAAIISSGVFSEVWGAPTRSVRMRIRERVHAVVARDVDRIEQHCAAYSLAVWMKSHDGLQWCLRWMASKIQGRTSSLAEDRVTVVSLSAVRYLIACKAPGLQLARAPTATDPRCNTDCSITERQRLHALQAGVLVGAERRGTSTRRGKIRNSIPPGRLIWRSERSRRVAATTIRELSGARG